MFDTLETVFTNLTKSLSYSICEVLLGSLGKHNLDTNFEQEIDLINKICEQSVFCMYGPC